MRGRSSGAYAVSSWFLSSGALVCRKNGLADDSYDEVQINEKGNRRVTISEFKGNTMVNIREYYEANGKVLPGKKACFPQTPPSCICLCRYLCRCLTARDADGGGK